MIASATEYALSALQEAMFFDTLAGAKPGVGVEVAVLDMDGPVDAERLRDAWQRASGRHDILRTAFRLTPDGPRQFVAEHVDVPFTIEDVALAGADEREWYVTACIEAERRRAFAPEIAPLQRVRLIRFGTGAQTLIWCNHHAILDGRARALVLRDIVDIYAGLEPARRTPFGAYIAWLDNQKFGNSEGFWRDRLRGFAAPTPLPAAFGPHARGGLPEAVERTLQGDDGARLTDFVRLHDLSHNVVVQAAWALVLARNAGTHEVAFGAVRAGRRSCFDATDVTGPMITVPPMRVDVCEDAPLTTWLAEVRDRWNGLRDHEHVPLRKIAEWSEITAPQRLFDSLVVYEREPLMGALNRTIDPERRLSIRRARVFDHTGFPLTLSAAGTAELDLRLQYDPGCFGAGDAARIADQLVTVLRSFPACAGGRVSDVPLLSESESEALVRRWNRVTPYPKTASVNALFDAQAIRTPNAVALQLNDATMTYAELQARAHRVAAQLRERGIRRGAFVGVHLERSFDMIAVLLGILKAGAASIALDPNYPPTQLAASLREAGAGTIVTQRSLAPALAPVAEAYGEPACTILEVEALERLPWVEFDEPFVRASDPAHVMYTSGSTGIPKGAVLPHQAVVRTVRGTDYLRFAAGETFFAFVPLTFDVSILEVWGPLLNGARLVLCPPELPSLDVLAKTIEERGVTTLWLTTALFEQMAEEQLARLGGLRQLIVGGDVMSPAHARRVMQAHPGLQLVNVCGPTEAAVLIAAHRLESPPTAPIPIGRPIPNATVYILDARQRPVPIGVPGEIYTGGAGVALGYLNQPELTAERFLHDPFAADPGATMYRSGDLGRWRSDGAIDFLGRADQQVKIRGIRIELGAIESALTDHPAIKEAVVVAATLPERGKQLVAYVVARPAATLSQRDVTSFLSARLPGTSVPALVAFVDSLPRTATGKFDRKALPDAAAFRPPIAAVAPERGETPLEIALAGEVAAILGLDDIGLHDDFYAFGGDSLRAMSLVARLRESFGVSLAVRDFVAAPTVAALAGAISSLQRDPGGERPRIRELNGGSGTPVFFLHGDLIGGGRYCNALAARLAHRPFYAVAPHGAEGDALAPSIEEMARENCAAIRGLYPRGPVALGGFCNGGVVAFEMARLLERAGVAVESVAIVDGFIFNTERSALSALLRREARTQLGRLGLRRDADVPNPGDASWQAWHDRLVESWYDALAHYLPRRYAGSVSLLWTEEILPRSEVLTRAWKRVAPNAAVAGVLSGTHLTAVTRHLQETSGMLAAALEPNAQQPLAAVAR